MVLVPAIDIRGGHAVRLERGDYGRETVYDADPADAAGRWVEQGARFLHVVDLDGARSGSPENLEHVRRIATGAGVPIQVGGGLRDAEAVAGALATGAQRVVLGTAALARPELVEALAAEHGDRIVAGVDARSGRVAIEGWERQTGATANDLIAELAGRGVRRFVYTPVDVDGTLQGPSIEGLRSAAGAAADGGAELIYSGGVGSLEHLRELAGLGLDSLAGVIVGRALYEGRFTVAEGQAALRK
ncbi:MAG TPA: 1-(5-phosphoribosyl)-5-[(5-phosphoribosylamino)methylideneamino]imidazole-4-carboxamide isomerase [Solirubrobacterales bacterium]|nr:1-(5-phosphoribosyl)-5-[(5-phosphoribosylamino)methylideneamino]imidazole-4-carboxamide isomerase [Solirubrobacterales bacterium]